MYYYVVGVALIFAHAHKNYYSRHSNSTTIGEKV